MSSPAVLRPARENTARGPGHELLRTAAARLRRVVPFDASGWFATDPATLMPTSPALVENVESGHCRAYWERESTVEDVLLFRDLRGPQPAGSLLAATAGAPERSARFREFVAPLGFVDELRVALRVGDRTWGVAVLLRRRGRPPFTARDVARVARAAPGLGAALAGLATAAAATRCPQGEDGPGTALFGPATALLSSDAQADRWFADLAGPDWSASHMLRSTVTALVTRARAIAAGRDRGPATARVQAPDGRWFTLRASDLRPIDGRPLTAVVVGPATAAEIARLLVDAHGLTPREQQVTEAVARGLSNAEIAAALHLSPHTVRDHLKAVFGKLAVGSRGELVATLFADRAVAALGGA